MTYLSDFDNFYVRFLQGLRGLVLLPLPLWERSFLPEKSTLPHRPFGLISCAHISIGDINLL